MLKHVVLMKFKAGQRADVAISSAGWRGCRP